MKTWPTGVGSGLAVTGLLPAGQEDAAWIAWFDTMGASVAHLGNPVFDRTAVGNCGPDTDLGGYTLVTADDFDAAVALARGCPLLPDGGGVEIGELIPVPGRHHPARDL